MPSSNVTLTPTFLPTYDVTIACHDRSTNDPLDLWVRFHGYRLKVGSDGVRTFGGITPGVHNLWVGDFCENVLFTRDTTISLLFPLDPSPVAPTHAVTFVVQRQGTPVESVDISLRGTTLQTNAQGTASFADIPEGFSTYKVAATGYRDFWGGLELGTADTTVQVVIYLLSDVAKLGGSSAAAFSRRGGDVRLVLGRPGRVCVDILDLRGRRVGGMHRDVQAGTFVMTRPRRAAGCHVVRIRLDGRQVVQRSLLLR
jgi:hypothetical protein